MGQPISVVADVPATHPGLGFPEYADALSDAIRGGEPPQFTIGLYGAWGSGKSSLLNAIASNLSQKGSNVIPVLFDAWRYEKSEHIVVPLLHRICTKVQESGDEKITSYLRRALGSVVYGLKFNLGVVGVDINTKDLREYWEKGGLEPLDHAFSRPFEELQKIPEALGRRRIAVLIDDLDRCSPNSVVSVLESINLVMDVPGFIFVLALDYDVLIKAVTAQYPHVSGDVFIEKIIQLPFRVPPLNVEAPEFIAELIPNWPMWKSNLPAEFPDYVRDIARLGLEANPRQIKRLVNSFLLLRRVIEQRRLEIDNHLLMAMIGVQLRWPAHYRDFQDSVLADDPDPFQNLHGDEDEPELQKYSQQFFTKKITNADLRQLLQLTAVVALEERAAEPEPATGSRESKRAEFIQQLEERGFKKSPRSERLYYNKDKPGVRFVVAKHVIRFEKGLAGDWDLWESYLITRETDLALQVIDHPNQHFTNRR